MPTENRNEARTTEVVPGSAGTPVVHQGGHGGTTVVEIVNITEQQFTAVSSATVTAAQQTVDGLSPFVKPDPTAKSPAKAKAGVPVFIGAMADLYDKYAGKLGSIKVNTAAMREQVTVAAAAQNATQPLTVVAYQCNFIANGNLAVGRKAGSKIYKRALAVAADYPEIAQAIAPFRDAFSRVGKKAVATRKRNKKESATTTAPTPPATTPPSVTPSVPIATFSTPR